MARTSEVHPATDRSLRLQHGHQAAQHQLKRLQQLLAHTMSERKCELLDKKVFPCGNSFLVETPLRELPHISGVVGS